LEWREVLQCEKPARLLGLNRGRGRAVTDDDVRKRLLEKPRFELMAKGVFRVISSNVI